MKIYKEKQFLIFDFEDGKTVKYDFATKTTIGKKCKPVKNLCTQLSGLTIDELIKCCTDKQYGKFLRFIKNDYKKNNYRHISNIGTILDKVPYYSKYEQIFSAGIEDIVGSKFSYTINDIPKGIVKLCREHSIKLSDDLLKFYKENPNGFNLAYNLDYISLDDNDIYEVLKSSFETRIRDNGYYYVYKYENHSYFNVLINEYGYTAKALLKYIDYCKTFEAIENMNYLLTELKDYASMMYRISTKFDKYPRHLLTTHRIASRNYNRLKQQFDENDFKKRIDLNMEKTFGDYVFIYPKCVQDIRDEAVSQNNCVASYIQGVIDGDRHILFLRYKDSPDKSLVTIEVKNGRIVQALQRFNNPLTTEQREVVQKWNTWYENKIKNDKKGELKYVS